MKSIKCTLLHKTPLMICSDAMRTCTRSMSTTDPEKELNLVKKVANVMRHKSPLEHIVMTFRIDGISRACLQEIARHRIASLSVESTRFTLRKLTREADDFIEKGRGYKYLVKTTNEEMNSHNLMTLLKIKKSLDNGAKSDEIKYMLPEAYRTRMYWTINMRSMQNFLALRMDKKAFLEIRILAKKILETLPIEYQAVAVEN